MAQILTLHIDCFARKDFEEAYSKHAQANEDQIMETGFGQSAAVNPSYEKRTQETLVQLFRFLQAKDIFIQGYLEHLSDRLLSNLSKGGCAAEQEIAQVFSQECGD